MLLYLCFQTLLYWVIYTGWEKFKTPVSIINKLQLTVLLKGYYTSFLIPTLVTTLYT